MKTFKTDSEIKALLVSLKDDDGMTLENGAEIRYTSGYQVGLTRNHFTHIEEAIDAFKRYYGSCGVWIEPGTHAYCIDISVHVESLDEALQIGTNCRQDSIYDWATGETIACPNA